MALESEKIPDLWRWTKDLRTFAPKIENEMVDKRQIEQVLTEQKRELEAWRDIPLCERREEADVDVNSTLAQVVIGVRRSGKSTLCLHLLQKAGKPFGYVNFDDELLANLQAQDLNDVLEVAYKVYGNFDCLFLDEVQNVTGWHLFVNRLLRQRIHIVLTGSNAKLLSGELATHLTGRHLQTVLYPFSFQDYAHFHGVDLTTLTTRAEAARREAFDRYLHSGGFPELQQGVPVKPYIGALVSSILKRDIEQRYTIKYTDAFERLAQHLMNVAPVVVNENELAGIVGLKSNHTVSNYIGYLKEAYLLLGLKRYSVKSRLRVRGEKVYPVDVALMDGRPDALQGENLGWRLETLVYIELLRRNRQEFRDVYYYRSAEGHEADFVVCRGNKVEEVYQVTYDMSQEKTRKRELRGLMAAANETGCGALYVITDFQRETIEQDGRTVHVVPAYEWLAQA